MLATSGRLWSGRRETSKWAPRAHLAALALDGGGVFPEHPFRRSSAAPTPRPARHWREAGTGIAHFIEEKANGRQVCFDGTGGFAILPGRFSCRTASTTLHAFERPAVRSAGRAIQIYRKAGSSKKSFPEHESDITLRRRQSQHRLFPRFGESPWRTGSEKGRASTSMKPWFFEKWVLACIACRFLTPVSSPTVPAFVSALAKLRIFVYNISC